MICQIGPVEATIKAIYHMVPTVQYSVLDGASCGGDPPDLVLHTWRSNSCLELGKGINTQVASGVMQVLQRILNARQFSLKLIANVTYGYTAAGFSGRMPCAELADSIVQVNNKQCQRHK